MKNLAPIPTPPWVVWRDFRIRYVPLIVFTILSVVSIFFWYYVVECRGTLIGTGEGVRSTITSSHAGLLKALAVKPFQHVNKGDPIAVIQSVDLRTQLDMLRLETELSRIRAQPTLSEQNAFDYEQVRVDWLQLKIELAIAKVTLQRAEKELNRHTMLYQDSLISEELYELSLEEFEKNKVEVEEMSKSAADIENRLARIQSLGDPHATSTTNREASILTQLEQQIAQVRTNSDSIILTAPIDGVVSCFYRQPGEYLSEGEPVAVISSPWSNRIVGYLRQPYPLNPHIGMPVRIATRSSKREYYFTKISHVGAQIEVITNQLAYVQVGALIDVGLPLVINIPISLRIRPGEVVDLFIESDKYDSQRAIID